MAVEKDSQMALAMRRKGACAGKQGRERAVRGSRQATDGVVVFGCEFACGWISTPTRSLEYRPRITRLPSTAMAEISTPIIPDQAATTTRVDVGSFVKFPPYDDSSMLASIVV